MCVLRVRVIFHTKLIPSALHPTSPFNSCQSESVELKHTSHQKNSDADLQQDPDNDDYVAVDEEECAIVDRPCVWGSGGRFNRIGVLM